MKKNIDYLRNLLREKEKNIINEEEKEKIENLKFILKNDNVLFELPMETTIGILDFLEVSKDEIIDLYFELISPKAYKETEDDYITISNEK